MKYFENCKNLEELKKSYKKLAFMHHPDRGGDVEIMKEINNEYEKAFNLLNNIKDDDNSTTNERANDYINIINELIKIKDITVELIGTWLWVSGNTYPIKNQLKALGLLYSGGKKMWYYHSGATDDNRKKYKGKQQNMSTIKAKYGTTTIKQGSNDNKKSTFKPQLV